MKTNLFMQKYQELINEAARCYREAMRLKDLDGREVEAEHWMMDGDRFRYKAEKELMKAETEEVLSKARAR